MLAAAFGRTELEPGHVPAVTTVNYARFLDVSGAGRYTQL